MIHGLYLLPKISSTLLAKHHIENIWAKVHHSSIQCDRFLAQLIGGANISTQKRSGPITLLWFWIYPNCFYLSVHPSNRSLVCTEYAYPIHDKYTFSLASHAYNYILPFIYNMCWMFLCHVQRSSKFHVNFASIKFLCDEELQKGHCFYTNAAKRRCKEGPQFPWCRVAFLTCSNIYFA